VVSHWCCCLLGGVWSLFGRLRSRIAFLSFKLLAVCYSLNFVVWIVFIIFILLLLLDYLRTIIPNLRNILLRLLNILLINSIKLPFNTRSYMFMLLLFHTFWLTRVHWIHSNVLVILFTLLLSGWDTVVSFRSSRLLGWIMIRLPVGGGIFIHLPFWIWPLLATQRDAVNVSRW